MVWTMMLMSGCCISHDWQEATCTEPRTCSKCGEREGEALGHTWTEATCTKPKTCTRCGAEEGSALGHTLTEANYQQAAICEVCGENVGEPLQAEFVTWGIDKNLAELNTSYDFETCCADDTSKTTNMKVTFSNYQTFAFDDNHAAKEGYEWKTVDVNLAVGDENAYQYGWNWGQYWNDFYYYLPENQEFDWGKFAINYNGEIYSECEFYIEEVSDWNEDGDLAMQEKYGWQHIATGSFTVGALVPKGYDGFVYGMYNPQREFSEKDALHFRFE